MKLRQALGAPVLVGWVTAHAAAPVRPNVLLIISDDQGYGDLSLHGNPHLRTPHLDRLATNGIQFDRFFVSPVCASTPASLLTGRYSLRMGARDVTRGGETMRSEEVTIAEALRGAGYRNGYFGKLTVEAPGKTGAEVMQLQAVNLKREE